MVLANQLLDTSSQHALDEHKKGDEPRFHPGTNGLDQLQYMADMIDELRTISAQAGLGTLTGILVVASIESSVQIKARRAAAG